MKHLLPLLFLFTVVSCGDDSYQYTESIVGEWTAKALKIKGKSYSMEKTKFILTFNEDLTYSLDSKLTKIANDYFFESIPFRGEGTFKGDYAVVSDNMIRIKEKYRDKIPLYPSIKNDELTLMYISRDNTKIIITLTKTPENE
ncbi:hypothetical protein [Aquimarina algicola]|uniref:Lipocalin-like domain-containing protein n=1 Tax=Aquimarina algicola TaxID=2589995 RepID=A0A504JH78_9FLAO|nr:hypothetical protein [Aquimarina algicola]TPN86189.1 hypothetical protein FHK87_13035 [Aquimarina algicola]